MDYKIPRSDKNKLDKLELEKYGNQLSLSYNLTFVFSTEEQAVELYEIQDLCTTLYRNMYSEATEITIHDKKREHTKISKAIETLKNHLWKYHLTDGIELIGKLNEIQPKIDQLISSTNSKYTTEPSRLLDDIQVEITERLKNVNFSTSNINENIMPEFTAMIKDKI